MDRLDESISSLVKPLKSSIEDEFSDKVVAALSRRQHVRQLILILAAFGGLAVALVPITHLTVAITDFLFSAPSEIPKMTGVQGALSSALVCAAMIVLTKLMRHRIL